MSTIRTSCGLYIDLDDQISTLARLPISTIAHSLAQINRYTGHAARPNSVAEHSLLVAEIMERDLGVTDPEALLLGLLHDAHEIVTNDMSSPSKGYVLGWRPWEDEWQAALHAVFGLRQAQFEYAPTVKAADLIARATEQRDLFPPPHERTAVPAATWTNLRSRDGMDWKDWRNAFIDRHDELQYARNMQHHKAA